MDAAALHEERVRQLERELDSLRAYLEEKENAVVKAAELGKALLRENEALEERLNDVNRESTQKIEELEQEKFSAQQKLECQKAALLTVQHDIEAVKTELRKEHEMREEHLKQTLSKRVHEAELLCSDLRGENDRLETQGKAYREKIAGLEERMRELTERMETVRGSSFSQSELRDLEQICMQERCEKEGVQCQLNDAQEECGLLAMEVEELRGKVDRLTEECQERSDQANEWYKALQASKEHVMELNSQLEVLKMENSHHGSIGNSLFGEVDDRRLQVEKKYVSLQVKHDLLEKQHSSMSQQYKRLKAEMSSLLCQFSVVGADAAHIKRLEMALRQAQTEKETLLTKLHRLEKQQASVLISQERLQYVAAYGDKKEYIALVELELSRARKENATLTKDMEVKGLQLVWESQKLRETEAKLHRKEQEMARGQKETSMLKLRLQEMQEKIEKVNSQCKQQEAQVNLLEKELQSQRQRGSQHRGNRPSQQGLEISSVNTTRQSTATYTSGKTRAEKQQSTCTSQADQLKGGSTDTLEGSEKENSHIHMVKKKESFSFLEDVEREFEKLNNQPQKDGTNVMRNMPKPVLKQGLVPPVTMRTVDSKVNQCPQQ